MTSPIDRLLAYQIEARHFPGALVHIEQAGKILAYQAVGLLGPESDEAMHEAAVFRLASLSKPIVSCAALMQVDEDRLALDAPLGDYLPQLNDLRMKSGERPNRAPTVRDLLRHTSGLAYELEIQDTELREIFLRADLLGQIPWIDREAFIDTLATLPLVAQPGTTFAYGFSTDVLGMIVAKLDGMSLGQSLKTRIFDRLGMHDTGFEVPASKQARLASAFPDDSAWYARVAGYGMRKPGQPWMESGGAGLVSTISDFASFARMLANGGRLGSERLISENLFGQMRRNQLPESAGGPFAYTGSGFGFGLGLAIRLDWGPGAMPCAAGEMTWSGISGTALFVHPDKNWFALAFTSNMASRMMARMEFRRAVEQL